MDTSANAAGVNKDCCLPPAQEGMFKFLQNNLTASQKNAAFTGKRNQTQEEPKTLDTHHRVSGKAGQLA